MNLNLQNKVLPVALVAALLGGTVGAFVMRDKTPQADTRVASANTLPAQQSAGSQAAALRYNDATAVPVAANNDTTAPVTLNSQNQPTDESCYRAGFTDGFEAARKEISLNEQSAARSAVPQRVVYRNAPVARRARSRSARTVYYDYQEPRKRSFWSRHRDKLTVAIGAGSGALIGGLAGGKKGALIGAGVGGGGAALYTYGLRNRSRRN